ncbi:MAG: JAB domain-containing protein [Bacteroidota bacterium]|jgi:DNA repair protein RadC
MKYCTRTITWRFHQVKESIPELADKSRLTIRSPEDFVNNYRSLFKDHVRERFIVFWLNSTNRVVGFEIISEGILDSSLVHPREVFRGSIVATAASIILAHNHPSENKEPSAEDIQITKQLVETGKIVGIPVHDHIIFGGSTYTSFAERGLL